MKKSFLVLSLIAALLFPLPLAHAQDDAISTLQAKLLRNQIQFIQPDHDGREDYPLPFFTRGEIKVPFKLKGKEIADLVFRDLEIDENGQGRTGMRTLSIHPKSGEDIEVYGEKESLIGIAEIGTIDLKGDGTSAVFWMCEDVGNLMFTYSLYLFDPATGKILTMGLSFETQTDNPKPTIERSATFKDSDLQKEKAFMESIKEEYSYPSNLKQKFPFGVLRQYNAYSGKKKMTTEEGIIEPPLIDKSFQYSKAAANGKIYTLDLPITEKQAKGGADYEEILEIPYPNIRTDGAIVQIQYSVGAAGKAQWFLLTSYQKIVLQPNSILLPVGMWIAGGLRPGYTVRIVLYVPED